MHHKEKRDIKISEKGAGKKKLPAGAPQLIYMFKTYKRKTYERSIAMERIKILEQKIKSTVNEALRKRYKELIAKMKKIYRIR